MFIAANWKMNLDKVSISKFCDVLHNYKFSSKVEACIFPSTPYIDYLNNLIQNLPISVGGQNCHYRSYGAFTGEVSPKFLRDTGCKYVIIGHSERRTFNNESDNEIKLRAQSAINSNLKAILCVGESLSHREKGFALKFIEKQLLECLPNDTKNLLVAYEPVWSIGTGKIPNISDIYEMHDHIKKVVLKSTNKKIKVLYGGSVNVENVDRILDIINVDGVLVGGASLKVKDFLAIYSAAVKHLNNSF